VQVFLEDPEALDHHFHHSHPRDLMLPMDQNLHLPILLLPWALPTFHLHLLLPLTFP